MNKNNKYILILFIIIVFIFYCTLFMYFKSPTIEINNKIYLVPNPFELIYDMNNNKLYMEIKL